MQRLLLLLLRLPVFDKGPRGGCKLKVSGAQQRWLWAHYGRILRFSINRGE